MAGERTDIAGLIERLEAATGPDQELDATIVAHLNNASVRRYPPQTDFGPGARWQFWSLDGAHFLGNESKFPVPPLTASLDAALALVERVRPGAWIEVSGPRKYLNIPTPSPGRWRAEADDGIGWGATPAIALLIALLRTLEPEHD